MKTIVTKILFRLLFASILFTMYGCGKPTNQKPPQMGPPEVGVITVSEEKAVLSTELSGRTVPTLSADVRPQITGIVQKRLFTEGADVKAGQILYQIDPAQFEASLAAAKAQQSKAEASLNNLKSTEERYKKLLKTKGVSQQEYDTSFAALKQGEAELAAAKATVSQAEINLNYTKIKAPISGRIGRSAITEGALVTSNQPLALATIQKFDPMFVDVTQSSSEILALRKTLASGALSKSGSTEATLILEDASSYPIKGKLKFSEITVDQGTGSVTLRAEFPNPKRLLLPGMFVRAVIEQGKNSKAILVPQRGVTRSPKGEAMVMIVGTEEKVEPRQIKVSITIGENWLVTEGLKSGDRVILEGIQRAKPGTLVKAVPFGSPHQPGTPSLPQPKKN